MYERMLNKQAIPTIEEMTKSCGENSERFSLLNEWLTSTFNTEQKIVFPYGKKYGWGVAHKQNGSPEPVFDMDEERTYLNAIIRIRDGFKREEKMSESMFELERARMQIILYGKLWIACHF